MDGIGKPKKPEGVLSPKPTTASIKSPMKVGTQATVKMPKAKKFADPFGKPSLFFKNEDFGKVKHPTLCKLRDFLSKKHKKQ